MDSEGGWTGRSTRGSVVWHRDACGRDDARMPAHRAADDGADRRNGLRDFLREPYQETEYEQPDDPDRSRILEDGNLYSEPDPHRLVYDGCDDHARQTTENGHCSQVPECFRFDAIVTTQQPEPDGGAEYHAGYENDCIDHDRMK